MARRISKRKRPTREDLMLGEKEKIEEGVFDKRTMLSLGYMFTHNTISKLLFLMARGKEANIYLAEPGSAVEGDVVVVKIFRVETSNFQSRLNYIIGDPRFSKIKRNMYAVVREWCKKEYGNLKLAVAAGVDAPKPYAFDGNVLAMEFIGSNGMPAPKLRDIKVEEPKKTLDRILADMRKLYEVGLVHADVSEYNVLIKDGTPYLIDFGQAVVLGHAKAMEFLRRDINNILNYFAKQYGVRMDLEEAFANITGKNEK